MLSQIPSLRGFLLFTSFLAITAANPTPANPVEEHSLIPCPVNQPNCNGPCGRGTIGVPGRRTLYRIMDGGYCIEIPFPFQSVALDEACSCRFYNQANCAGEAFVPGFDGGVPVFKEKWIRWYFCKKCLVTSLAFAIGLAGAAVIQPTEVPIEAGSDNWKQSSLVDYAKGPVMSRLTEYANTWYECESSQVEVIEGRDVATDLQARDVSIPQSAGWAHGRGALQHKLMTSNYGSQCNKIYFPLKTYEVNEGFHCYFYVLHCKYPYVARDVTGPATGRVREDVVFYECTRVAHNDARDITSERQAREIGLHAELEAAPNDSLASVPREESSIQKLDDSKAITCGKVQSCAPIPPFPLTTFPTSPDCNMISYGGVSYETWAGCTCEFYFIPCNTNDPLITATGPDAGDIPREWAHGYKCWTKDE
ncbi:hypothetical protein K458DRAFT_407581 [Lentithecium fluviatile CBS 122367]|uniref:Uncharacterized protein n=1 Tax=Lentithecium fluviatile CBS 122367 TaxID=1168545 RepID=A0A6G1IP23_9PLEO|nr:hypothetical protein K458DRAFT_407581 [Lentithecium fluviatile CBS 122367]